MIFRCDEELEAVRLHASQHDHLAVAILRPKAGEDARTALHHWRVANRQLFREIVISWRSQKLRERIIRSRGPAAYSAC